MDNPDTDEDFVLSAGPGYAAALCTKCNQIKPVAEFKRRITRARAKAMGYAGNVLMEVESSMCKACQPRRRPLSELNRKELRNLVMSGDVHESVAEGVIAKRRQQANWASRKAVTRAWDNARTAPWAAPIANARKELTRLRQQEKYAKREHDIDLTFFVEYKLLLSATIARMKFEKMRTGREPKYLDWQGFIDATEWGRLFALWERYPQKYRARVKTPALFAMRPGDAEECKPIKTLRTTPSPAERLAQGGKDNQTR